jgi:phage terminase large subunit
MSETKSINAGTIHQLTRKAIEQGNKVIVHKGGTGSGKTFDLMIYVMITFAMNNQGVIATVVSESKPHLDIGCIRYAKGFQNTLEMWDEITYNESKSFF